MSMFVAVNLLIVLEHTMTGAGTHEVVVALTRCQAAAHRGSRLVAAFTSLTGGQGGWKESERWVVYLFIIRSSLI